MNCPVCGKRTRVMESRPREGGVWRRRKCAAAHLSYTIEGHTAPPAKRVPPPLKKPKPKPPAKPKREPKSPYSPAMEQWNLKVTADSPLWLRSMAMKLG